MGDEQDADAERLLELAEQVEDALLDRHVEARGRLVGHDQRGPGQHRQADQHPLEHAARQLVRIGPQDPVRVGQADLAEGLEHALAAGGGVAVRQQRGRLKRLRADRPDRVQRVARVLRDEAELAPAQRAELALPQLEHVLAVELDPPGSDSRLGREQPQDRARDRRLARPRLADQGQALAARQFEAHIANHGLVAVGDGQAVDAEQRRGRPGPEGGGGRGRLGGGGGEPVDGGAVAGLQLVFRSHLLILLIERTVMTMTMAGP